MSDELTPEEQDEVRTSIILIEKLPTIPLPDVERFPGTVILHGKLLDEEVAILAMQDLLALKYRNKLFILNLGVLLQLWVKAIHASPLCPKKTNLILPGS